MSANAQKRFIVANASILDRQTKLAILGLVHMEIVSQESEHGGLCIMESKTSKEVSINLDQVQRESEDVLSHIYNIVVARREQLNRPALVSLRSSP